MTLVVNGGSGGASVTAANVAAAITSVADAETVTAALRAEDVLAAGDWTATAGVGSATAATLTLTTSATATAWSDIPRLVHDHGGSAHNIEVEAGLAALSGGLADTFCPLALRNASNDTLLMVQIKGDDRTITVYDYTGTQVGTGAAINTGTGRLKLVIRDGVGSAFSSNDGGDTWTLLKGGIQLAAGPAFTKVVLSLYQGSTPGGAISVQWDGVKVRRPL